MNGAPEAEDALRELTEAAFRLCVAVDIHPERLRPTLRREADKCRQALDWARAALSAADQSSDATPSDARRVVGHRPGCFAAESENDWYVTGKRIAMDRRGHRNDRMLARNWLEVRCQDPDCPAWGVVHHDAVTGLLREA